MVFNLAECDTRVRQLFNNQDDFPQGGITTVIRDAIRRMSIEKPREASFALTAASSKTYNLDTLVTDWMTGFSVIRDILCPIPDIAEGEDPYFLTSDEYQLFTVSGVSYLRFDSNIPTGKQALVTFTTYWKLLDLDQATATTLSDREEAALVYLTASLFCQVLATEAAGKTKTRLPSSGLNFDNQADRYRRLANEWEGEYRLLLSLASGTRPAIVARDDFEGSDKYRMPFMTHGRPR